MRQPSLSPRCMARMPADREANASRRWPGKLPDLAAFTSSRAALPLGSCLARAVAAIPQRKCSPMPAPKLDLKLRLFLRIAALAALCFGVAAAYILFET